MSNVQVRGCCCGIPFGCGVFLLLIGLAGLWQFALPDRNRGVPQGIQRAAEVREAGEDAGRSLGPEPLGADALADADERQSQLRGRPYIPDPIAERHDAVEALAGP